ncbi:MAG TPA: hypothetical protein VD790_10210 [Thermoleophilaceae bacterium]|nr:hypothetical protein [Thermoleophilaceae bacterium]
MRVLDPDAIEDALRARGYEGPWLEATRRALEAMDHEKDLFDSDLRERIADAERASSEGGTSEQVSGSDGALLKAVEEKLSTKQTAAELGQSEGYARRLGRYGELPATKNASGGWEFDAAAVRERARRRDAA